MNKNILLCKPILLLICFLSLCQHSGYGNSSKTTLLSNPVKSCSYLLKESTSYNFPIGVHPNEFNKIEQLQFQNKEFTKRHNFSLDENRNYTHTVDYVSRRNLDPYWLTHKTEQVVFDKNGYKVYSAPNRPGERSKVENYEYTQKDLETFQYKKESLEISGMSTHLYSTTELLNFYEQIETAEINYSGEIEIVHGTGTVTLNANGTYLIQDEELGLSSYIDPINMVISIKLKHENGIKKIISNYKLTDEGYLVPKKITIKTPQIVSSGHCIEEVMVREYSDYNFLGFEAGRFSLDLDQGALEIVQSSGRDRSSIKAYPNPVSDLLYIDNLNNAKTSEFVISDFNGRQIQTTVICEDENSASINLESLASGIYFISILSSGNAETLKFIKL